MKPFKLPRKFLGDLDAEVAAKLVVASADVALVIDGKGVIRDLALDGRELVQDGFESWVGRPWIDTVTVESRTKIEELLGEAAAEDARTKAAATIQKVVSSLPDAFVVVDMNGIVLTANEAFVQLAELASEELVKGQPVSRWMGRSGVDFDVLRANLREHDTVHRFNTVVMGEFGTREEVELSAVAITSSQPACIGLVLRRRDLTIARPLPQSPTGDLTRSVEHMTKLVGQVPLKDLVREATDIIERMCIEAALQLTRDNRACAAEILGLSRQSLYMKLRRYGLSDHDLESAS